MPRFLSDEWVAAFNTALSEVAVPEPGPDASLSTRSGHYTMAEEIRNAPEGAERLILEVAEGGAGLRREQTSDVGGDDSGSTDPAPADVTITLAYEDALALSTGELSAADALNAGRIRVRGDLSVLIAAERMLAAARDATAGLTGTEN